MAVKIAMIATTIINSTNVKPLRSFLLMAMQWPYRVNLGQCSKQRAADRNRNQCLHSAGTYLNCAVVLLQAQVTRPDAKLGVNTMDTVVPTEVAAFEPAMVITPPAVTDPPVILPPDVTVRPAPALAKVLSVVAFSEIEVLKALAASTNSDTLARIV